MRWACDFYVDGAEQGRDVAAGYALDGLTNVDHHAPTARMARELSSTTLALAHVTAHGIAAPGDVVVINHVDCDSVLSAAILSGRLPADPRYDRAAIAADHTGTEEPIADLLQGLEDHRDLERSLAALAALERGRPLPPHARAALDARRRGRDAARRLVASPACTAHDGLAVLALDEDVDTEFVPALLPAAWLILMHRPRGTGRWSIKLRLGRAAAPGFTLHTLALRDVDPAFGGRWNAGSNRRGGGTTIPPERYVALVAERLAAWRHAHP
jgi:hypothetical protein